MFQGRAFSLKERQLLGIHGLLPPSILTQDQQVFIVMQNFYRWDSDLDRYIYLMGLQDRNEKLFYRVIAENVELMMPVIYTPTVGLACQKYGLIFRKPRYVLWALLEVVVRCSAVGGVLDSLLSRVDPVCRVESLISVFAVCWFSLLSMNEYVSGFLVMFLIYLKHINNIHIE